MKNDRISSLQFSILAFFLISSFLTLAGYHVLTSPAKNDAIFSILIGMILGLAPIFLYLSIIEFKKEKTLLEKIDFLFPKIKVVIRVFLLAGSLFLTIYSVTILTDFIHLYLLKNVPILLIRGSFVLVLFYVMTKNLETIVRTGEISFYLFLFFFLLSCIGIFSYVDLQNLKPLLTEDSLTIFQTGLTYGLLSTSPLFFLTMISEDSIADKKKVKKRLYLTYLFTSLFIFLQILIPIGVLGIRLTNLYLHPEIAIYKKIAFLNIIERVETILAAISLFYGLFYVLMVFYTAKETMQSVFRVSKKKERLLLVVFSFLILFLSHYLKFSKSIFIAITFFTCLLFPFLIFLKVLVQKRKKKTSYLQT